jgi:thiosulfate dehydrogenase (quinone) large subunit
VRIQPLLAVRPDSVWARRLTDPGWLLLPLRGFLGITFCYAGLQKLANPDYLNSHRPISVAGQMHSLQHSSPIGPLLGLATHAPVLVGLLIAFGELAVGVGTLLALYTRVAAAGGALLSLTFFLTVSWNTSPYYYGSDIVFIFAWLALLAFGPTGVLSLDGWLRNRARASLRLGPEPATVPVSAARLHALCPRAGACGMQPDGACARIRGCPVFPVGEPISAGNRAEVTRRTVVRTGLAAALVGGLAALLGAATAAIGRSVGGTRHHTTAVGGPKPAAPVTRSPGKSVGATSGTAIGAATAVPVGQAKSFTDPATGNPAWIVHPSSATFVAFNATCTHAGCPVQYDPSSVQFVCPCHGGVYDARTGKVLQGPPPAPLQRIPVRVVSGQLRVDG